MKKRKIITGLMLTMALTGVILSGCGDSEQPNDTAAAPELQQTEAPILEVPTEESIGEITEATDATETTEVTEPAEENKDANRWYVDLDNHWKIASDGSQAELAPHAMVYDFCSVCNAEIMKYSDGVATVTLCDDSWNEIYRLTYAADGTSTAVTTEYTYDANGIPTAYREYTDDVLTAEGSRDEDGNDISRIEYQDGAVSEYEFGTVGEDVFEEMKAVRVNITLEDGTKQYRTFTYDEFADPIGETLYNEQDEILEELVYIYDDNGCSGYRVTEYHEDGTTTVTEHEIEEP